jgi:site-specific recombinase
MKDLLLYQEKLVEKISQYKELEGANERMNEHCKILRNGLNELRKESAERYKKVMELLEENRSLKEKLLLS